jgi:hypothetical protein
MAATREHVIEMLERMGVAQRATVQSLGGEVIVEADCEGLSSFQRRLEAEGIASTLETVEEEGALVSHGARRYPSTCMIIYSLRVPVN